MYFNECDEIVDPEVAKQNPERYYALEVPTETPHVEEVLSKKKIELEVTKCEKAKTYIKQRRAAPTLESITEESSSADEQQTETDKRSKKDNLFFEFFAMYTSNVLSEKEKDLKQKALNLRQLAS